MGTMKLDATLEQLGWESSVAENAAASSRVGEQGMPKAPPIRVLICDDHRILSDAMAILIGTQPDLELVAEPFERAAPAIAAVAEFAPDVVLMDVELWRDKRDRGNPDDHRTVAPDQGRRHVGFG